MRYPVGKTEEDFRNNWYNAQGYGVKTSYGYHEGDDLNLKTGGSTDLGQPLYAIEDGEISGVDTTSTTGFGKQIFIKFKDPLDQNRFYWCMYAHCQSVTVKQGDQVTEGQQIGTLGKSGTTAPHLHFSIKNTPNGMDNVANTLEELSQWENPTKFIEARIGVPSQDTPLKDKLIDWDDEEGHRHEVGWYVREWYSEKTNALEIEKVRGENNMLREQNAKLVTENGIFSGQNITLTQQKDGLTEKVSITESEIERLKTSLGDEQEALRKCQDELMQYKKEYITSINFGTILKWIKYRLGGK